MFHPIQYVQVIKMFEVKKEEYINKTFRMKKTLVQELERYASVNQVSLNELVSQCCQYALDNKKQIQAPIKSEPNELPP